MRLHRCDHRKATRGPLPASRYRRGGFATREAAAAARQAILDGPADRAAAGAWTVARWLRYWLTQAEPHLRPSTLHGYRDHIDRYLIPSIGRITLADLTGKRLQACFDLLARQRTKNGALIAASTVNRVRATLRAALNVGVREGLITANPLAQVRLDKPARPACRPDRQLQSVSPLAAVVRTGAPRPRRHGGGALENHRDVGARGPGESDCGMLRRTASTSRRPAVCLLWIYARIRPGRVR